MTDSTAKCSRPEERFASLDALRFIASIGIVFYHCSIYADVMGWQARPTHIENFRLFVDLFFVLSGFVMMHVYGEKLETLEDFRYFLRKRLARVYPLHALMVVVFVALGYAVSGTPMADRIYPVLDPAGASANLLLLQAVAVLPTLSLDFPSWSVSAEWFLYLLFPICAAALKRMAPSLGFVLAILIAFVFAECRNSLGLRDWTHATFDFGALRALPSFIAGIAVFGLVRSHPEWRVSWKTVLSFGLVIVAMMAWQAPPTLAIAFLPAMITFCILAERQGFRYQRLASWLGSLSFSIYLTHAFIMLIAAEVIASFDMTPRYATVALHAVTIVVSIPISAILFRFYESPMRRLISQRPGTPSTPIMMRPHTAPVA